MVHSRSFGVIAVLALSIVACGDGGSAPAAGFGSLCPQGEPVVIDGHRRLALIVGVGDYANPRVPDLDGPGNDARRMYELLTDANGLRVSEGKRLPAARPARKHRKLQARFRRTPDGARRAG